ncbi:putative transcription factor & chromatin remodeling ARID family [Helianthus annuus]|uniref:Transcription factor & chromatin remodeling ARID family n=1 Tax=Helianthus annuus TaxID=4232 RepID=A0A9K3NCD5_HELAN|nr:putative transcription factor & chromatin remodeling ARID family [Helianthus annuus]
MLDDVDYVRKYKFNLESKYDEMVDWFLTKKLEIVTRPIPAYDSDNRKVSLLELYMVVKREGGQRRVTENNLWVMVAKDMGFEYHDGEFMRLMYAMYLDVLIYYHKFKSTQTKVFEKEMVKSVVDPRRSRSEGDDKQETVADQMERNTRSDDAAEHEGEHYAFYAGKDWQGMKKLQKRRKIDLKQVKMVVDDVNRSVLMHSHKYNYV